MRKVVEVVLKVLGSCAEGARRLCGRCLEVMLKVVEVVSKVAEVVSRVVEVVLEVLGDCAEGSGGCTGGTEGGGRCGEIVLKAVEELKVVKV